MLLLCSRPEDALEDVIDITEFLRQSLCAARELEYTENARCGLQLIFFALLKDLATLRDNIHTSD